MQERWDFFLIMDLKLALLLFVAIGFVSAAGLPSRDDWFPKEDLPAEDSSLEDAPARDSSTEYRVISRSVADADEFNEPARRYYDAVMRLDTSRYSRSRTLSQEEYDEMFDPKAKSQCVLVKNKKTTVCCPLLPVEGETFNDRKLRKQYYKECKRSNSGDCGYKVITTVIYSTKKYTQEKGEICREEDKYKSMSAESMNLLLFKDIPTYHKVE